ncbi:MAG: hypothetical protein Q7S12_02355 [bacterium]|nr:hypothetical protein [bacterium]
MAQESIADEIKWLEQKLEAKRHELGGAAESKPEKELVKDVIKEVALLPPPPVVPPVLAPTTDDDSDAKHIEEEKEHSVIVEDLVKDALTNGILHAVKMAGAFKNPHILDDFHDTLADKYYEKLLESRKLKQ